MQRILLLSSVLSVLLFAGCGLKSKPADDPKVLKFIMSDSGFNSDIVQLLKKQLADRGFTLEWVVVTDTTQPNHIIEQGLADANAIQHEPYFNQFVKTHGLKNVVKGFYTIHTNSGLFSWKYKTLAELPDGALIGLPRDVSNNGRVLFMLQSHGLLKMRPDVEIVSASVKDIAENPHNYRFKEVDQMMMARTLEDVDAGFLFSSNVLLMKRNAQGELPNCLTGGDENDGPYKSIVAIRRELIGAPKIKALQEAYASEEVKAFYRQKYGETIVFLDKLNP